MAWHPQISLHDGKHSGIMDGSSDGEDGVVIACLLKKKSTLILQCCKMVNYILGTSYPLPSLHRGTWLRQIVLSSVKVLCKSVFISSKLKFTSVFAIFFSVE